MSDDKPSLDLLAASFPVPARVLSVGADIIDVARVQKVLERQRERFLKRVFTMEEREYCEPKSNPYPHFAARFAAKEAVSKAFSTGIGALFSWTSASVYHGERMQPRIRLDEQGEALLKAIGGTDVRITLSHTKEYAMAVAMIVQEEPPLKQNA